MESINRRYSDIWTFTLRDLSEEQILAAMEELFRQLPPRYFCTADHSRFHGPVGRGNGPRMESFIQFMEPVTYRDVLRACPLGFWLRAVPNSSSGLGYFVNYVRRGCDFAEAGDMFDLSHLSFPPLEHLNLW